jgi:hypothetical protein
MNVTGYGGANGIQWNAYWSSPNSYVHGVVGMTQLADITNYDVVATSNKSVFFNDYFPALDYEPQYGQKYGLPQQAALGAGAAATYEAVDSPYVPAPSCLSELWPYEQFTDYFTFTPDPKGNYAGIPVTIASMVWQ